VDGRGRPDKPGHNGEGDAEVESGFSCLERSAEAISGQLCAHLTGIASGLVIPA
jgi:hypothetical protein